MPNKVRRVMNEGLLVDAVIKRAKTHFLDLNNTIKYGFIAPKVAEMIFVHPRSLERVLDDGVVRNLFGVAKARDVSGWVVEKALSLEHTIAITDIAKVRFCIEHWVNGKSWEETGAYHYMVEAIGRHGVHDGCSKMSDIIRRYEVLDYIFEEVRSEGRLKTVKEIEPGSFRGRGEALFHIGPGGRPLFDGEGGSNHRLAIAYILQIPMPGQIGCVHKSAIKKLRSLRYSPDKKIYDSKY